MIRYGITYFPLQTQVVISRIKSGLNIDTGRLLSWESYDRKQQKIYGLFSTYRYTTNFMSRRARSHAFYGNR